MLEYEWGNPSPIIYAAGNDEHPPDTSLNRQILDPYGTHNFHEQSPIGFINPNHHHHHHQYQTTTTTPEEHHHHHHQQQQPFIGSNHHFHPSIYDTLAVYGQSTYSTTNNNHQGGGAGSLHHHSLEPSGSTGYIMVPKTEPLVADFNNAGGVGGGGGRIGLNLGGRTYFASSEDDFVSRLYRRSRIGEPGSSINSPRCQAEGCNADLSNSKHYHRRHKVCEFHSKASTVITAGLTQRFCQQCSRFHLLTEFDNGKRSCRKRLADHNRRRRKSQQPPPPPPPSQHHSNKSLRDNASNSASKNIARSPAESGAHSSSMTSAVSEPRMSLNRFKQKSYQVGTNSSASAKIISNWD